MNGAVDPVPDGRELVLPSIGPDAIDELEALLEAEQGFLERLDTDGIEAIARRKEQLLPRLQSAATTADDLVRLSHVRERALRNQLLTVHVRDVVAAIVGALGPAGTTVGGAPVYPSNLGRATPGAPAPARLSVKG